jgi:hypothetical protein
MVSSKGTPRGAGTSRAKATSQPGSIPAAPSTPAIVPTPGGWESQTPAALRDAVKAEPEMDILVRIPAHKIQQFSEIDLGKLGDLPSSPDDLIALSMRMEESFNSVCMGADGLIAHDDISRSALDAIIRDLALGFIERNGALAFYSTSVLKVIHSAQRLQCESAQFLRQVKFLQQVGQRLAVFVRSQKNGATQTTIDITYALNKPHFVSELQQLSREMGTSEPRPGESKAEQFLRLVESESSRYEMLGRNLLLLEQFFGCQEINPHLKAKNAIAAERLAHHGAKGLRSEEGQSITPDWFFYTWIAWRANKSPKTVRKLIQTSKRKLRENSERR